MAVDATLVMTYVKKCRRGPFWLFCTCKAYEGLLRVSELCCSGLIGKSVARSTPEECTTPRIGSRNIKIKIGGGGLPTNQE